MKDEILRAILRLKNMLIVLNDVYAETANNTSGAYCSEEEIEDFTNQAREEKEAVELSLVVLQEQLDRLKGCEYCTGQVDERKMIYEHENDTSLYIDGNNLLTFQDGYGNTDDVKINNCPKCGRKLKEITGD